MKSELFQPIWSLRSKLLCAVACVSLLAPAAGTAQAPGGFVESAATSSITPQLSEAEIRAFLPSRGEFTFPAPWLTEGVRLTNSSDCGGNDCVHAVGYSYWRNINNHAGSDTMLIFLGLNRNAGGGGPTLFQYDKTTGELSKVGPLFDAQSQLSYASGEGWYFSASMPTKLYLNDGPRMLRYDVVSEQFETVFDANVEFGGNRILWQMHSSYDDRVHSATLRDAGSWEMLGCAVYREDTRQSRFFPKSGAFDECQIDKSGRWLVIKEDVDGVYGEDNRIVDVETGQERNLLDRDGAAGHSDTGYGYFVAADNWNNLPNATRLWKLDTDPIQGPLVFHNRDWSASVPHHVSHSNARPGVPPEQQYACGSGANRVDSPFANDIFCFRLDSSDDVLVVAPVMTDLDAPGGGDDYSKLPKGNLDVTGEYLIWTSNMGGDRLDAFLVRVPGHLLTAAGDIAPPSVSLTTPVNGAAVSGIVSVAAAAADDVGVAGVQFKLDGVNLGAEVTGAPYSVSWNSSNAAAGAHTLTAVARDAAGNSTISAPVSVTVGDIAAPVISGVSASVVTPTSATIAWTTNEPSDSQVEYGTGSTYGGETPLDASLVTAHSGTIAGLSPGTGYVYRVKSRDAKGNLAVSGDLTFTTSALADLTPPSVALASPADGADVSAEIELVAFASDDSGVAGVQFQLGGVDLGPEDPGAPYAVSWDTRTAADGPQTITAVARDAAGNTASATIAVNVRNDTGGPVISAVKATDVTSTGANIGWTTDEPGDSQVEYGTSTLYGRATQLDSAQVVNHGQALRDLTPDTVYHFRVRSRDASGNLTLSDDFTFTTSAIAAPGVLVGHWTLDEGEGAGAADSSGNNLTAALKNGAAWGAGVLGSGVIFDGADDFARVGHADSLNTFPLSVALWVRTGATGLHGLVNKYWPGSMNGYQVFVNNGNLCAWYFRDADNHTWDGSGCTLKTPGYNDNRWHHVVFTVDASGARLYVDGAQKASQAWSGAAGAVTTTRALSFGRYPGTASPYLPGALDDIRIYGRALDAAEVAELARSAPIARDVAWTNLVNASADGNSLTKVSGCDGCGDAGATSSRRIESGHGYMEFTATVEDKLRIVGLTESSTAPGSNGIDFGLRLQGGIAEVRENGAYRWDTKLVSGDLFRISVEDGTVRYWKNGVVFYTSSGAPAASLTVDSTLHSRGATITEAVVFEAP